MQANLEKVCHNFPKFAPGPEKVAGSKTLQANFRKLWRHFLRNCTKSKKLRDLGSPLLKVLKTCHQLQGGLPQLEKVRTISGGLGRIKKVSVTFANSSRELQ
jgi:hypothetical protein